MSGEQIVERLEAVYGPFRQAVAEADLDRPTVAGWTAKEMVAHVAFWKEASVGVVRFLFRGERDVGQVVFGSGYVPAEGEWPAADVHNAREAAWAHGVTTEAVLARLDRAHELQVATLATLTDEEERDRAAYLAEMVDHIREHHDELRAEA